MRKLATIRIIDAIDPIPDADKIEVATIGGWKVVIAKGQYNVGDKVIYLEIDSFVPIEVAPFLPKGEPREYEGIRGERLRTVKLRGQISQGLILPLTAEESHREVGEDITDLLGIVKWEKPEVNSGNGLPRGSFPSFIPKTDQERCQNLKREIAESFARKDSYEITVKLDGSSITVYRNNDDIGVCSRNQNLKLDMPSVFVDAAKNTGLLDAVANSGRNIAVQGELMGPGVQGNRERLTRHNIFVFDIFDIDQQRYLDPLERAALFTDLKGANYFEHVPITPRSRLPSANIDDLLAIADGPSLNNTVREGLVFKRSDGKFSFKAISNKFLLKSE